MKYFYKFFAVISVILGIFIFFARITNGEGDLLSLGLVILIFGGVAYYLWRLSEEEQISHDGVLKAAVEPAMCGTPLKDENDVICSNSAVKIQPPSIPEKIRNPFFAVIFSFFFCGWGQWYNGNTREGLKFFGAALLIILIMSVFLKFGIPLWDLVVPILFFVLLAVWIYGMSDAKEISEKINNREVSFSGKSRLFWFPTLLIVFSLLIVILMIISAVFVSVNHTESPSPFPLPRPFPAYVPLPTAPNPLVHPPQYIPPQYVRPPQYIPPPHI